MTKKFQRMIEDFTCGHCGAEVIGNGYTNHCPTCLYSCHVDINPGDRAEKCGGLMAPISAEQKRGDWVIKHHCLKCGFERPCKTQPDEQDSVIALMKKLTDQQTR